MRQFLLCAVAAAAIAVVWSSPADHHRNKRALIDDTTWSVWGACSASCDGGMQSRSLGCTNDLTGDYFPDCLTTTASCNDVPCDDPFDWQDWGACSVACGSGTRSRVTGPGFPTGPLQQEMMCNTHGCVAPTGCGKADLLLVLDASGSVSEANWFRTKQFVLDVTSHLDLDPTETRIAVATFSTEITMDISLGGYTNSADFRSQVWDLPYTAGATNTADGIRLMREMAVANTREGVKQIMVVITDGDSNILPETTIPEANLCRAAGITVFAIGVGSVSDDELQGIANDPDDEYFHKVSDYEALQTITETIIIETCETANQVECGLYGDWDSCSVTCGGGGIQLRTRECRLVDYFGNTLSTFTQSDSQSCGEDACSFTECDPMSDWDACSASCEGGTQSRTRECRIVNSFGDILDSYFESESQSCNDFACPTTECDPFSDWDACSASCEGGTQSRTRECRVVDYLGNILDSYFDPESQSCNDFACPTIECDPFGDWNTCSVSCGGGGTQSRTRDCHLVDYLGNILITTPEAETQSCGDSRCPFIPDCSKCDFHDTIGYLLDLDECQCFYVCVKLARGAYRHYHQCCANGLFWSEIDLTCTWTMSKAEGCQHLSTLSTTTSTTSAPWVCPYDAGLLDPSAIMYKGDSMGNCPSGHIWDKDSCSCQVSVVQPPPACDSELLLHFPFDDHFDDVSCHKALSDKYGNPQIVTDSERGQCAYFDGYSRLTVGFLYNWFASQHIQAWTVSVWFKREGDTDGFGGLVNNGDCKEGPSFDLFTGEGDIAAGAMHTSLGGGSLKTLSHVAVRKAEWEHLVMVYNGAGVMLYLNGVVETVAVLSGDMENRQCPMNIGHEGENIFSGYFNGYMDELRIYTRAMDVTEINTLP